MHRLAAVAAVVVFASCSAPKHAAPPPLDTRELGPALAKLAWWPGAWASLDSKAGNDGTETWVAADGALYGVALHSGGHFEVLVIDDAAGGGPADGKLRLYAMPDGKPAVELDATATTGSTATFANPANAWPTTIGYARDGAALVAKLGATPEEVIRYKAIPDPARAPELEAADLAFAKATADGGAAGWAAAFASDGTMGRKGEVIERAGVEAAIAPLLAEGKLVWAPIASGLSASGDVGFTVGKAHFEPKSGKPADAWRSTYVTIWRREDNAWKVRFDTGRAVNE